MKFWLWLISGFVLIVAAFLAHARREPDYWQKPWKKGWRLK